MQLTGLPDEDRQLVTGIAETVIRNDDAQMGGIPRTIVTPPSRRTRARPRSS